MKGRWDVSVPVVHRYWEAIEQLLELAEGDQGCVGTIIGEAYARIWWVCHRVELRIWWVTASELNQISRLHDSATGNVP